MPNAKAATRRSDGSNPPYPPPSRFSVLDEFVRRHDKFRSSVDYMRRLRASLAEPSIWTLDDAARRHDGQTGSLGWLQQAGAARLDREMRRIADKMLPSQAWLDRIHDTLESSSIAKQMAMARERYRAEHLAFETTLPGTVLGDIFTVFSRGRPEWLRQEAAERLAIGVFSSPLAPQRRRVYWRRVKEEIQARAAANRRSEAEELRETIGRNLFLAVRVIGPLRLFVGIDQVVRGPLSNLFMEDVLGPRWRRSDGAIDDVPEPAEDDAGYALVECEQSLRALAAKAGLSTRDTQLLILMLHHPKIADAARELGIKPVTARVAANRARKKIREIL